MPLYPYECIECQNRFEVLASLKDVFSEDFEVCCPSCNSMLNRRLVSRTSFSLKGEGWYKDGYTPSNVKKQQ